MRAWLAPAALVLLAALETIASLWLANRTPNPDDYAALRAPMQELLGANDALVVQPRWAEPHVRRALGSELLPLSRIAPADLSAVPAAVEISLGGHSAPELHSFAEVASQRLGPFTLRRLHNPLHVRPKTSFVDDIATARVSVERSGLRSRRCMFNPVARPIAGGLGGHPTWPKERFVCPGEPHVAVGETVIADAHWLPRRCVLAPAPTRGRLIVRFPKVELGDRLVGHGGLYWMTERSGAGAPIQLDIAVDDALIGTFIHADGDGWRRFEMSVPKKLGLRDVSFIVSSPGVGDRDFCFEARSL